LVYNLSRLGREGCVRIPPRRVIVFSSTHIGFISKLTEQNTIIGVANIKYICCDSLLKRKESLVSLGDEFVVDNEKIISLRPDIVFISGYGEDQLKKFEDLHKFGITVIPIMEYTENTALNRAKWILVFGVIFDKFSLSQKVFKQIEIEYNNLQKKLANYLLINRLDSPSVFVNIPFRGVWYVPGGNSYIANLIKHAGGSYVFQNYKNNVSFPLSFEQVYERAKNADILLNPNTAETLADIYSIDKRLKMFKAVREGKVFNFIKQKKQNCYNFWEKGVLEPHLILSDLINIFYPKNTIISHHFYYYQKLK